MSLEDMAQEAAQEEQQEQQEQQQQEQQEAEAQTEIQSASLTRLLLPFVGVGSVVVCGITRRQPLNEQQIIMIAEAAAVVAAQYEVPDFSPKAQAWLQLAGVVGQIVLTQPKLPEDIEGEAQEVQDPAPSETKSPAGQKTQYESVNINTGGSGYAGPANPPE